MVNNGNVTLDLYRSWTFAIECPAACTQNTSTVNSNCKKQFKMLTDPNIENYHLEATERARYTCNGTAGLYRYENGGVIYRLTAGHELDYQNWNLRLAKHASSPTNPRDANSTYPLDELTFWTGDKPPPSSRSLRRSLCLRS